MNFLKENLPAYEFVGYENIECIVIPNVLSVEECEQWIKDCETKGFESAFISDLGNQVLDVDIRLCQRCFIDNDIEKLDLLSTRLKQYIDKLPGTGHILNPRLRFLKYHVGNYFKQHYDGDYRGIDGKCSEWTIQIYLNDNFTGGETTFIEDQGRWKIPYKPQKGSVILFHQSLLHEGNEVINGIKYSVRTDVLCDLE